MKISYIESPEGLSHRGSQWNTLKGHILSQSPDLLVTNEMPFGNWLAASREFNAQEAQASVIANNQGIEALQQLDIPIILSSRPVATADKLANEAFALVDGEYHFVHQKHYFPEESGFYERAWFDTDIQGFKVIKTPRITVGFMLCTELMFNEWARAYKRQGAHLIAVPRASGQSLANWKTAAAMAAIVSGCYVVSSNRVGRYDAELTFGGKGFAFAPDGSQISETTSANPVVSFELDFSWVNAAQSNYPCYVKEID
ncbi:MAG: carbon-nitrogen hydrolase family protein [Pseudomonadales bacterium]|nr:carbon-nitrogen hydrolase family protein [Pseudomonadales bacterium]NRA16717.1 carbon-nitrogen hydrolase family protein [Oceanospirillaceae bacterium]